MPHELIDESRGPGVPAGSALTLQEIWAALGHDDGRVPTLDEVLIEIREMRQDETSQVAAPPFPEEDENGDPVDFISQASIQLPSVSWGAFGMTVIGFSAEDVLKIRAAYAEELKKRKEQS